MNAFMFDLDGTLLNTLEDIGLACNTVLAAHGYPCHELPTYRQRVGRGFHNLVRTALPPEVTAALSPEEEEKLVVEARTRYSQNMMHYTHPYDGMTEALQALAAKGHKLAVFSNKPHELTASIIAHYFPQITFSAVRGARTDTPLKPDPAGALRILHDMQTEPAHCYYVGDSDVDMITARNAGMLSVGVAWGFRGEAEVREAGARHIVQRPACLLDLPA